MDSFRHQRSPGSERFLTLFDLPPVANSTTSADGEDELHEDDIFWTGADTHSFDPCRSPMSPSPATASPSPAAFSRTGFWRFPERNFGILAALPEDDKKRQMAKTAAPFLQRKTVATSSAGISTSSSPASTSPSFVSASARMIPTVPKSKSELALSMPGGKIYHQSAPVNVPVAPPTVRSRWGEFEMDDGDLDGDEKMLRPHEIVARKSGYGSPMTTFSVLEGIGRTLKGRDLRRVRNAVWRKTGFID